VALVAPIEPGLNRETTAKWLSLKNYSPGSVDSRARAFL